MCYGKIPAKKKRNKEQEVAFENTDVKSSGDSKDHTLTKGSLLTIVLGEGKGNLFLEKETGFGAYTIYGRLLLERERGRREKHEAKQILHVTKEVGV